MHSAKDVTLLPKMPLAPLTACQHNLQASREVSRFRALTQAIACRRRAAARVPATGSFLLTLAAEMPKEFNRDALNDRIHGAQQFQAGIGDLRPDHAAIMPVAVLTDQFETFQSCQQARDVGLGGDHSALRWPRRPALPAARRAGCAARCTASKSGPSRGFSAERRGAGNPRCAADSGNASSSALENGDACAISDFRLAIGNPPCDSDRATSEILRKRNRCANPVERAVSIAWRRPSRW